MKRLKITKGISCLVDDRDFKKLSKYKWFSCTNKNYVGKMVVEPDTGKRKILYMHRAIMNPASDLLVDHINGNKLDNRRSNLRICTRSQNLMNRGMTKRNQCGFKGVSYSGYKGKPYRARITVGRIQITIGYFKSVEEAARAYNEKCRILHGNFAVENEID